MNRMKVLWLARTIPLPLDAGDRIYTANLVGALAEFADVTFLGLAPDNDTGVERLSNKVDWRSIPAKPAPQRRFIYNRAPMAEARFIVEPLRAAVVSALKGEAWDAVVLDHYAMAGCLDIIERAKFTGVLVHVAHDFETHVTKDLADAFTGSFFKRWMLIENSRRVAQTEQKLMRTCQLIVALTKRDSELFQSAGFEGNSLVLAPGYGGQVKALRTISQLTPRRAVSVGSFEWTAKQHNLERFLDAGASRLASAGIELRIIGKIPEKMRSRLQLKFPSVDFAGFVPDLAAEFDDARVALVFDETGGGFKLKMLDYLFSRVPLFGVTDALQGLPEALDDKIASEVDLASLVHAIITKINDIELLNGMQEGAYAVVRDSFSWLRNGELFAETLSVLSLRSGRGTP